MLPKDNKPTKNVESKILSPLPGRSPPPTAKGLSGQKGPPGTLPKAKHCYSGLPKHHTFLVNDELYGATLPATGYPSAAATLSMNRSKLVGQQLPYRSASFNGTADPRAYKDARGALKNRVTFLDQRNNPLQNGLAPSAAPTANGRGRPVKLCVTVVNEDDGIGSGSETDHTNSETEDRSKLLSRAGNGGPNTTKLPLDNRFHHHQGHNQRQHAGDKLNYSSDWTNDDDDDTTTTSGSYVVDPEDMGIEIEAALASMDARSSNV